MSFSPTLNLVNESQAWLIFVLGVALGAFLIRRFDSLGANRGRAKKTEKRYSLSDVSTQLLEVLAAAAVEVNAANVVIRATQGALALGLLRVRSLVHEELLELVRQARNSQTIQSLDTELSTGLRGATVFVAARAINIGDGNVLLLVEDRTEAKRLDETRRDFIANISHELKTPIGAISLLAEAIADAADDPVALEKFTKSLTKEAKRLAGLVQDTIQLSRFQSTEIQTNAELVDLADVVEEAVERNAFRAERRNVKVNFLAPKGIRVIGDQEMLIVALKNLIENAIIYSDENDNVGVGLRVNGDVAEISVTDSGIGLDPEDQKRVFERFYRVDPSRSRQTGGTGLGLSIVKHVALSHNGEVQVFSKPGVGSTFTLRLPLADTKIVVSESDRSGT